MDQSERKVMKGFLLVLAALLSITSLYANPSLPAVQQGLLDLRGVDLKRQISYELAGDWEFYWDEHITGRDAEQRTVKAYRRIPLPWSEGKQGEVKYPAFGRATYRLKILLLDASSSARIAHS